MSVAEGSAEGGILLEHCLPYFPGHTFLLHSLLSLDGPWHERPPCIACRWTDLVRFWVPPPQRLLHDSHELHSAHLQFTGICLQSFSIQWQSLPHRFLCRMPPWSHGHFEQEEARCLPHLILPVLKLFFKHKVSENNHKNQNTKVKETWFLLICLHYLGRHFDCTFLSRRTILRMTSHHGLIALWCLLFSSGFPLHISCYKGPIRSSQPMCNGLKINIFICCSTAEDSNFGSHNEVSCPETVPLFRRESYLLVTWWQFCHRL